MTCSRSRVGIPSTVFIEYTKTAPTDSPASLDASLAPTAINVPSAEIATEVPNRDDVDGPIVDDDSLYGIESKFSVATESVEFTVVFTLEVGIVCDSSVFSKSTSVALPSVANGKSSVLGVEIVELASLASSVELASNPLVMVSSTKESSRFVVERMAQLEYLMSFQCNYDSGEEGEEIDYHDLLREYLFSCNDDCGDLDKSTDANSGFRMGTALES